MTPEQFAELLKIATSVGGVVWNAALKQVEVNVLVSGVWIAFLSMLGAQIIHSMAALGEINGLSSWKVEELPSTTDRRKLWARGVVKNHDEGLYLFLGTLFTIMVGVGIAVCASTLLYGVINPEWAAIKLILELGN